MMGSVRPGMAAKIAEADSKLLDEEARLAALQRYRIVDTPREERFDKITALVRDGLRGARIGILRQAYQRASLDSEVVTVFARASVART